MGYIPIINARLKHWQKEVDTSLLEQVVSADGETEEQTRASSVEIGSFERREGSGRNTQPEAAQANRQGGGEGQVGEGERVAPQQTERETDNEIIPENISDNQGENEMANLPKALAQKVGESRVAGGGNYIQHGDYIMMIKKWHYQQIQDEVIILEVVPIESRKKVVYEGEKRVEIEPNPPGSEASSVANFSSEAKLSAPANSRAPVLGLFGFAENDVPNQKVSETLEYVCSDAQPAFGMLLICTTFPKEIRSKKGSYITGLNWDCVAKPGTGVNSPEMVKARLEALARSPEELVKVAMEQLTQARAAGGAPQLPVAAAAVPPPPAASSAPSVPVAVAPPPPVASPPPPAKNLFEGWTVNPADPQWYYRYVDGKAVQKLGTDISAGK